MKRRIGRKQLAQYLDDTAPECLVQNSGAIERMRELARMAERGTSAAAIAGVLRHEALAYTSERVRLVYRRAAEEIAAGQI
jgi:hypothetical protein